MSADKKYVVKISESGKASVCEIDTLNRLLSLKKALNNKPIRVIKLYDEKNTVLVVDNNMSSDLARLNTKATEIAINGLAEVTYITGDALLAYRTNAQFSFLSFDDATALVAKING